MEEREEKDTVKVKRRLTAPTVMLLIAGVAVLVGLIAPPVIKRNEDRRISKDVRTASAILDATRKVLKDPDIESQVTTAGYTSLTWTASGRKGIITCTNGIKGLQTAVESASGDISRHSKTLGTATWTVTAYPTADGSGFSVNGAWSGAIGADDASLTTRSGGSQG
ncbi:hypothetical protein [Candidatus Weimeria sp. HCP3S3_B5]|uniref:hypothetical protein n=1 Tax=Candidatus Weimeria sp. HCP3S3_B5 TaxID=3438871 RepID=UPI00304C649A|nr:hypothetical protein [Lachnospiraceae bacterium]